MSETILLRLDIISKSEIKKTALKERMTVTALINTAIDRHIKRTPEVMYKLGYKTAINNILFGYEMGSKNMKLEAEDIINLIQRLNNDLDKTFSK